MTDKEYEQKKRECWEEFWDEISGNIDFAPGVDDRMKEHIYDTFDRAYVLGKQEKGADTVIQGWVARDLDGEVFLYENKPERGDGEWLGRISSEFDFQQLKWGSDPIEVEIIIKQKKNG